MIWRRPLLICLQPAQVAAGGRGQASSKALPNPFVITTVIAETDTPSGLVYVRFGVSPGAIASQADAQGAQCIIDSLGTLITTSNRDMIALPQGTCYLTDLSIVVPSSQMRLWMEVINSQGSDATRTSVIFKGTYIDEGSQELAAARESGGSSATVAAAASSGLQRQGPITP